MNPWHKVEQRQSIGAYSILLGYFQPRTPRSRTKPATKKSKVDSLMMIVHLDRITIYPMPGRRICLPARQDSVTSMCHGLMDHPSMLLDHLGSFQANAPCPLLLSLDIRDYYSYHRLDAFHRLYDDIFNSELQPRRHRQSSCSSTTSKDPTLEGSTKNPIHPASTDYYILAYLRSRSPG